jgi:hypothetical protein
VASAATRREKNDVQKKRARTYLTPTGLLMEGVLTSLRRLFAKIRVSECNDSITMSAPRPLRFVVLKPTNRLGRKEPNMIIYRM